MNIYVAAPWVEKDAAIQAASKVQAAIPGLSVTSRWFQHQGDPSDSTGQDSSVAQIVSQANEDLDDIYRSDLVLVLNLAKSGGKSFEAGFAYALGKPIIYVGPRLHIFEVLGDQVETLEEAIELCGQRFRS